MPIQRLFVANRGEIAVRIIKAAKSLGIETVVGVSEIDTQSLAAEISDRTVVLGPSPAAKSYLDEKLVSHAAIATGCDALHPGYGFLSERASFAQLCEDEGLTFVGPRPETIEQVGDKLRARELAEANKVPLVPGTSSIENVSDAIKAAKNLGFPVLMKAAAGGGGKGMFVAWSSKDISNSFERAFQEAKAAFGDGSLYLERYIETARHVEVQIIGDGKGGVWHFGERDCSLQRRYQKVMEEAPCAVMPAAVRSKLYQAAVNLASGVKYRNAGTVEFLFDVERNDFHFIEVNARIQVEHPITEEIVKHDLVQYQLKLAAGQELNLNQSDIKFHGHAIEARINAEDPNNGFSPSPGMIKTWRPPQGKNIRLDSHCRNGDLVPPFYDSLLGKLIVQGSDRAEAVENLTEALNKFKIAGLSTNLSLHQFIAAHEDYIANRVNTQWLENTCLPAFMQR